MRKLTKCFANKFGISIIFCLLIVSLAVVTFTVTAAPVSNEGPITAHALSAGEATRLSSGKGLQFGSNSLNTFSDFYVERGNATLEANSIKVTGDAVVGCKALIVSDGANLSDLDKRVFYAMQSSNIALAFNTSVSYKTAGKVSSDLTITTASSLHTDDASDSLIFDRDSTQNLDVEKDYALSESVSAVAVYTPVKSYNIGNDTYLYLEITISGLTGTTLTISKPTINISATADSQSIDIARGLKVVVRGDNRTNVTINDALSPEGRAQLENVFVKPGDKITVQLQTVDMFGNAFPYDNYYTLAMGMSGNSCINWHTYANANYSSAVTHLDRTIEDQTAINDTKTDVYKGFVANFEVRASASNASSVCIIPRLIDTYSGTSYTYSYPNYETNIADTQLLFKVDSKAPAVPVLDTKMGLGYAIENGTWYNDVANLYLQYDNNCINDSNTPYSHENVYAFLVSPDFIALPDKYDFTPGKGLVPSDKENNDLFHYYTKDGKVKNEDGAIRQELGTLANSNVATSGKKMFSFEYNTSDTFGLILYAVDEAGNVSGAQIYATINGGKVLKVDLTTRSVGAIISSEGKDYVPSNAHMNTIANFANIYVIGDEYHKDGVLTDQADDLVSATPITNKLVQAKRGEYVTVRIIMSNTQLSNNVLTYYTNNINIQENNPQYKLDKGGNRVYDVTYKLDGDVWTSSTTEALVTFYFNKIVKIKLDNTDYTFTMIGKNAQKIQLNTDDFTISLPIQGESLDEQMRPDLAVEYFDTLSAYLDWACEEGSNGEDSYKGYGKLNINGKEYPITDAMGVGLIGKETGYIEMFLNGEIGFFVKDEGAEYRVYGSHTKDRLYPYVENGVTVQHRRFIMNCYNINAGHTNGVADAGLHIYRVYVPADSATYYNGEMISDFTIKKASPEVIDAHAVYPLGSNLEPLDYLEYGRSLEELVFKSKDSFKQVIEDKIEILNETYVKVASGVYGTFDIISPQIDSPEYKCPPVPTIGGYPITIEFTPFDVTRFTSKEIEENYETFFKEYYDIVLDENYNRKGYKLKDGKQTATNYSSQVINLTINVVRKKVELSFDDAKQDGDQQYIEVDYNGAQNLVTVNHSGLIDSDKVIYVDVLYSTVDMDQEGYTEADDVWATEPSETAGRYKVIAVVDDSICNYWSEPIEAIYIVNKRELKIELEAGQSEHTTASGTMGEYTYEDKLTYTYSHMQTANYVSSYQNNGTDVVVPDLQYEYRFIKYRNYDADGNFQKIDNIDWTWSETGIRMIAFDQLDAGEYLMQVSINNRNNKGILYVCLDVKQIYLGDKVSNLGISTPGEVKGYDIINLDGTFLDKAGHIEFGQTLASMSDTVLGLNSQNGVPGTAYYMSKGSSKQIRIMNNSFRLETEQEFATRTDLNVALEKNGYGEDVLPVLYDGDKIMPYKVAIVWQALKSDGITPDYNFRSEKIEMNLYVARAKADFSEFRFKDIIYGDLVKEEYVGQIQSHGFIFDASDYTLEVNDDISSTIYDAGVYGENEFNSNGINCTFTPAEHLLKKYVPYGPRVKFTVHKREVDISLTKGTVDENDSADGQTFENVVIHNYGALVFEPKFSIASKGIDLESATTLRPQFRYLRDYNEGEILNSNESLFEYNGTKYVEMGDLSTNTPVGKYYVYGEIISSETNYFGSVFSVYYVVRAELNYDGATLPKKSIEYGTSLNSVNFGTISLENANNMTFSISGTFRLYTIVDGQKVYDVKLEVSTDTNPNVYVEFVPSGSETVQNDYRSNYVAFEKDYYLEVLKRNLVGTEYLVIENLEQVFDDSIKEIKVTAINPEDGTELPIHVDFINGYSPRFAGEHPVKVTIDASVEHYTADVEVTLVIKKAELNIDVVGDVVNFKYNGSAIDYKPAFTIVDTNIPEVYSKASYNFVIDYVHISGMDISFVPFEIGSYVAYVTLEDQNFYIANGEYDATKDAYVKEVYVDVTPSFVDDEPFANLVQTYCAPGSDKAIIPVVANYDFEDHPYVEYLVEYKIGEIYYDDVIPFNAGSYDVRVRFSQNGYNRVFNLTMVIEKAMPDAVLNAQYERAYTGAEVEFSLTRPSGVETINYLYRVNGSSDEYSEAKPIIVGDYDVKVIYEGANYYGVKETLLKIVKGDFDVTASPKAAPIAFSSLSSAVEFIDGVGVVEFNGINTFASRGYWSVVTDISEFEVGLYNVQVKFTLNADDVDFRNFNDAYAYMDLNVVKKDISDAITIADDYVESAGVMKVTRNYIKEKVAVSPVLVDAAETLVPGYVYNPQTFFTVYYNDNNTVPTDVNTYNVTISIADPNYSGSISNVQLQIIKAVPVLTAPNFNVVRVGDVLNTAAHIQNGSGSANVKENGFAISGSFHIAQDYAVEMTKANVNTIAIYFYPDDLDNVSVTYMDVEINVIGDYIEIKPEDVIVEKTVSGDVVYGMPLSSYSIKLSDSIAERLGLSLEEIGTVEWVNPDAILHVGDTAEFRFVPADTNTVTITYHTTDLAVIIKSDMDIQADDKILILYENGALSGLEVALNLFNVNAPDMAVSGYNYLITSSDIDVDYVATASDIGKYLEGTVSITVSHPDYNDLVLDGYKVFVQRLVTDFNVANVGKYYDGEAVTLEDLGVTLAGTDYVPSADELEITSILLNGKPVTEIKEAGVYTVTIEIKEKEIISGEQVLFGSHAGSYTFTYTISKLDLSDLIEISGNNTTYLQPNRLVVTFGEYTVEGNTIVYNFYSENYEHNYGAYAPNNAGNYKVVVSIADSNPYYKGSKEFDYVINKMTTTITLQPSYTYTYNPKGTIVNVVPEIENNVTEEYVSIKYAPIGSSIYTNEVPVNAGTYSVVVDVVNHPNIIGSATTTVIIRQATVSITVVPSIGQIGYGEMLKNATITGGIAENNYGDDILGHFEFENGDKNDLPVGDNSVNIVFVPANANYARAISPVNVTIVKGVIGVEFGEVAKFYTGKALYPEVLTGVNVSYAFRQNGINVPNAISAGVYTCTVTVEDKNYTGSATTTFTIHKAVAFADESVLPAPSGVVYGNVVGTGVLSGGSVVYVHGESGVLGSFSYVDNSRVLGDVGVYEGVQIVFNPADSANYEPFYAEISVEVVKANATIAVSANSFVYGDRISKPVFTTDPQGLDVSNLTFDTTMLNTIQPAGTYMFEAEINAKNYQGKVTYAIFVTKKMITVNFYRNNVMVDDYKAEFGNTYYADVKVVLNSLVEGEDRYNYAQYEDKIIYKYVAEEGGQSSFIPPTKIGKYTVTAILEDSNYIIDPECATTVYEVTRAHVAAITFDSKSLSEQVYGSVSLPIVLTTPANVGYEIVFNQYATMPTNAGSYDFKVIIRDDNYYADELSGTFVILPKPISIENIKAYDKAYDGLSSVEVVGDTKGVMSGDNVFLKLTAHTKDHAINVGVHPVVISGWELTGLHKANYVLRDPIYNLSIKITNKTITDPNTDSYITSADGFSSNITVSFTEVYDTIDKTNFFTSLVGQKATVQVITVKENGLKTTLDSKVKFHVRIPDEYVDARNLTVEGRGALSSVTITREGEYVTFYADTSGEIVFYKNDFPYWIVIVAGVILILVLGGMFALILSPVRRRKRIPQGARRMYEFTENLEANEARYKAKVKKQIEEKKRRWRY